MPYFAEYDPSVSPPSRVVAWYDVFDAGNPEGIPYPKLPAEERLFVVSKDEWAAHLENPSGWAINGGKLVPYQPRPSAEVLQRRVQTNASGALAESTQNVVLRCFEEDVPVPDDWKAYRRTLRDIAEGTTTVTELPTAPPHPFKGPAA